jgi:2-dehydropantoate 2-reductase
MRRIGVFGAGAIGCNVATDLVRAGHDVRVVDPWPEQVVALRTRGLKVTLPDGGEHAPPLAAYHLSEFGSLDMQIDVALITMKSQDARWMAEYARPHLAPGACVVGLMNGMNDEAIASIVGRERTLGAVIELAAELFVPGEVRRKTPRERSWFALGELDGAMTARVEDLRELLSACARVTVTANIAGAKWTKLVTNSMVLSPFAMLAAESYEAAQDARVYGFLRQLGRESIAVGAAHGYVLEPIFGIAPDRFGGDPDAIVDQLVGTLIGHLGKRSRNTAFQDVLKKRRTETEYINGLVVRLGREAGIPTPANEAVCEIVRAIECGELEPGMHNLARVPGFAAGATAR